MFQILCLRNPRDVLFFLSSYGRILYVLFVEANNQS